MGKDEALSALAAYLRARRSVGSGAAVQQIPATLRNAPTLPDLVTVLDGFVGAAPRAGHAEWPWLRPPSVRLDSKQ